MTLWGRSAKVEPEPPPTEQQSPPPNPFFELRNYEVWCIGRPTPWLIGNVNAVNINDGFVFFSRDFQIVAAFRQYTVDRLTLATDANV